MKVILFNTKTSLIYKKVKETLQALTYSTTIKKMPVMVLVNQYTLLEVVNRIKAILYDIVSYRKSIYFLA